MHDDTASTHPTPTDTTPREIVIGLLADPGLAETLASSVAEDLPPALDRARPDGSAAVRWRVETVRGPVGLDSQGLLPMLRSGDRLRRRHHWDVVVLITDLPRRTGTQPLVSDFGADEGVGLVSLPALGAVRLAQRLRAAIVDLVVDGLLAERGVDPVAAPVAARERRWLTPPLARVPSTEEGIDAHLALQGTRGSVRLLAGLVRANRPWRLVPSLGPTLAAAAAGSAFGVFYSNIWELANALSPARLAVVLVLAVAAMSVWLITDNGLWERPAAREHREEAALFNAATAATISSGVACMTVLLFVITTGAAALVIPPGLLPAQPGTGSLVAYLKLGVLASSMGVVAGALGSKLTSPEAVRSAAYSAREQQRRALIDEGEPNSQARDEQGEGEVRPAAG
jgi:hypothetical protein